MTPTATATDQTMETRLAEGLRQRGQRVTPQRLAVARVLEQHADHVTAEILHRRIRELMPGVSLPTVYATLELLEDLGLVARLLTESGAVVYDPNMSEHHHLVCRACGAILDVEAPLDDDAIMQAARRSGFQPASAQVVVSGVCGSCRN